MKLKRKIQIDKYAGLPLVYMLNVMARIMGFFLRIDHSLARPVKTIAVCKFVGLGSIIQATPLLQTLRKNYPEARIIFITNSSNQVLLNYIPEVSEVLLVSDKNAGSLISSTFSLLFKLWKQRPDIYIDLEIYSNYSSAIATMSLSRNRMGFYKDDKTYRKGIYTHMMYFSVKSPISQSYLQFARLLGCKEIVEDLKLSKTDPDNFRNSLTKLELDPASKYIAINPNASDLRLERRWSSDNFIQLINLMLYEYPDHYLILVGDKSETAYVSDIYEKIEQKKKLINSSGKLTLQELIALIDNAAAMITNDTGPMHIAFALKTKTVALFGPCSPQQYGGMGNVLTLYKNVYCSPCVHEFIIPPCKGDNQCMKKINVEEVLKNVKQIMQSDFKGVGSTQINTDYVSLENTTLGVVER